MRKSVRRLTSMLVYGLTTLMVVQSPLSAMERELLMLMDIPLVVTASRTALPITEAPATIDIVTQDDIEKLGLRNLADALRIIPGMDFADQLYTTIFSPRGLNSKKLDSGVLCLLDGHPYYQTAEASTVNPYLIPLTNVKRIEVIKGPGSALYGANAFTGVINIITKTADDVNGTNVRLGAGDYDTQEQELVSGYRLKNIEFLLTALRYRTLAYGGHRVSDNDDVENREVYAKVNGKDWAVAVEHITGDKGVPGTSGSPQADLRLNERRNYVSADYGFDLGEVANVKLLGHVLQSKLSGNLITGGFNVGAGVVEGLRKGLDVQVTAPVADQHTLVGGFNMVDEDNTSEIMGGEKTIKTRGLYLQEEWRPWSPLIVTIGGRYDMPTAYDNVFSPRANITYKIQPQTVLKTSYGEAFRAPSFVELYVDALIPAAIPLLVKGNTDLKPEKIKTAEVGVAHRVNRKLNTSLNLFRIWTDDLITETQTPVYVNPPAPPFFLPDYVRVSYGNAGRAEVIGGEASVQYAFTDSIGTQLSYAYQEGVDVDAHKDLILAPRYKLTMRWDVGLTDKLRFNTFTWYIGERTDAWLGQTKDISPFCVTNTVISYAAGANTTLRLTVNNIFDNKDYVEITSIPLIGRHFIVDVQYHF